MTRRPKDRRRGPGTLTTRPPSSPVNLLLVAAIGVLGITAAAAAFMGGGYDDVTPHGQVLGGLHAVAQAQEQHYARTGGFAQWLQSLAVPTSDEVEVSLIHASAKAWEATARHEIGLTCTQRGRVVDGVPRTDPPACYAAE